MGTVAEHYCQIDGVRIRYLTAGTGPAVIFLHGVGDSALDWRWIMPRLAGRFRLIAPDLPGYSSGAGHDIAHTPADYSRLLLLFMDDLGLASATIAGNSLGGLVAIRMARQDPSRVLALVLISSAGLGKFINPLMLGALTPAGDFVLAAATTWTGGWLRAGLRGLVLFANPWRVPWEWYREQYRLAGISSYRRAVLAVLRQTMDFTGQSEIVTSELPDIDVPTLVLWGWHDRMVPISQGRRAMELLKAGTLHILPDCGHAPHIENPARFAEVLENFLNRL